MNKFFEIPKNDPKAIAENSWFQICRKEKIPFIIIKSRKKYADVHWDYITYPNEVDKILNNRAIELRDAAIEIFKKHANERSKYSASNLLVSYENLEIPQAKLAAEELYDLIVSHVDGAQF